MVVQMFAYAICKDIVKAFHGMTNTPEIRSACL